VRNGVLRNEAQVADVVQAVEAQLEQTEHQRQEAAAARNALNDPAAAAAALAATNSERSRSRMKHSPNLTALPATARLSPGNGPASRLSPNQKPAGFPLDAVRAQPHSRSNSTSAARAEAAQAVAASPSAASAATPMPLSMGVHLTTPSHHHPSRRLDSSSLAAWAPGGGASPSPSVGMHADLLADRADSCESPAMRSRTWTRTSDVSPVATSASLSPVMHVARPMFAPSPPLATAPTAATASNNTQSPRRCVVRIQIHRPTNSNGSSNSNTNNHSGNDRARQKWQAPPANEATVTQPQSPV
jgi:hypothetical protein